MKKFVWTAATALLLISAATQATPKPVLQDDDVIVFSSPPRETAEIGNKLYQPVAAYLSKVLGKKVVYKYPRTFGVYRAEMLNDGYDLVFDGAHFIGYRILHKKHTALVRLPNEGRSWVVFMRRGENLKSATDLAGKIVCAQPTPTIGALVILSQFSPGSPQPFLVSTKIREDIYRGVLNGSCTAGVLPITELTALNGSGAATILYESPPITDQGFSAGPRLSPADQAKIIAALTSPEAAGPTEGIRKRFKGGDGFIRVKNEDYIPFADLLRNEWGFADLMAKKR